MELKRRSRRSIEVATSSMNDIMFFLMLFFLIVSTLATPNALKLVLPQSDSKETTMNPVSVTITPDLIYLINGKEVQFDQLEAAITEKLAGKPEPSIVLNTDQSVPVGNVVQVMNIANKLKVKMVIATTPEGK